MKSLLIFILYWSVFAGAHAQQTYDPDRVNRKAVDWYNMALNELSTNNDRKKALEYLDRALDIDSSYINAHLTKAGIYADIKDYTSSVAEYNKARSMDTAYFFDMDLPYSISLAGTGDFQGALQAVTRYLTIPHLNDRAQGAAMYRQRTYQFALDMAKEQHLSNYVFAPVNLGDSVNTRASEYLPSLTLDGNTLIFTRNVNGNNEDFYESHRGPDGKWSLARPLEGDINTPDNEGAQNISQDGKMLVFTGCNRPDGFGSCDIYYALRTKQGWSTPMNIGEPINTEFWESQPSLSPDKRDLYFAARDPSGFGGSDIWVSHRLPNGAWGNPQNLGTNINTKGDESCPFIHADNQTLYFTSNGLPGYGGTDLFVVRKDSTGHWGKPMNLGYPINTIDNEGALTIAADGKTAYYAADRSDTRGGLDIYTFEVRDSIRPFRTLWVKGKVFDKKTREGLPSGVDLTDLHGGQAIARAQTDEEGNYLITLPVGKEYAFSVHRKGYLFYSAHFDFTGKAPDSTYEVDIPLQPLETGAAIVLKNIFFDTKKFDLKPESIVELEEVVSLMKENPTLKIQISGHTDNVGQDKDNMVLSNARAISVINYLMTHGVAPYRLAAKGYGATHPIADNATEAGRALNRRTELSVVSN
ncbi:OmpA family protein [Dinghuibacter silviterrae]|uniref:WD40 repeat protein n=1 Tax=Dinghuibacter silviterrae TaxID=1539049 RepID=A0A4V3GKH9_9BACT|nr:OmpA family protein [Dinghuibacter silviterrae]TDW95712.1 WD40 repeat protein [Dinghuibacter silviterrae]